MSGECKMGVRGLQTDTKYAKAMAPKITGELKSMIFKQTFKNSRRWKRWKNTHKESVS
jgi:hypothetical protein